MVVIAMGRGAKHMSQFSRGVFAAIAVTLYAARTDRAWLVPLACAIANPALYSIGTVLAVGCGAVALWTRRPTSQREALVERSRPTFVTSDPGSTRVGNEPAHERPDEPDEPDEPAPTKTGDAERDRDDHRPWAPPFTLDPPDPDGSPARS